jgi:PhzF family phenazine biosynthesis protein
MFDERELLGMTTHKFKQVDVFTDRPFFGNPVAVVLDARGIDADEMQRIAAWTNLSETTFVLPPEAPGADYRLRIFTPAGELPFAGHPTIGSAHAVLEAGIVPAGTRELRQECGAGILPIRLEGDGAGRLIFAGAPEAKVVRDFSASVDALSEALGTQVSADPPPASVNNGPVHLFVHLESAEAVRRLRPDMAALTRLSRDFSLTTVAVFTLLEGEAEAVHIRCFAPAEGIAEDPVTGSANAALPAYLARHDLLDRTGREYVARQGEELGRAGRVHIRVLDDEGRAEFGGRAITVIEGEISL